MKNNEKINLEGLKRVLECIVECMATTIICVFCFGTCAEMGKTIGMEREPYYWLYIAVYVFVLVVYKHIFINKIGKRKPLHLYSNAIYYWSFGIYLFLSTLISTVIEYFIMSAEDRSFLMLYAILVFLINFLTEKRFHYWGMMFFNTRVFVAAIFVVTICNFVLLHFAYKGAILIIIACVALVVLGKIFSAIAPNGIVVDSHGNIGYFYKF